MQLHRRINITIKAKDAYVYHEPGVPTFFSQSSNGVYVYWRGFYSNENADFGITVGSLNLEEVLCDSEFSLRQLCASKFEVQCFNLNSDLTGCEITVTCTNTQTNEEIPLFVGIIDSSTTDNFGDYRDIIAYDKLYTLRDKNVGEWWDDFWESRPTYTQVAVPSGSPTANQYYERVNNEYVLSTDTSVVSGKTYYYGTPIATIGQLRASLCASVGLNVVSTTLLNDDIQIKEYMSSDDPNVPTQVSFGDLMSMICEINGVFGHINREGNFEFVDIVNNAYTQISADSYEKKNVKFEDYTTKQITGINVFESNDDLMLAYGDNTNAYSMCGNIFTLNLDSYDILNTMCLRLMNILLNVQYIPCSIPLIVSDLSLKVGDKIISDKGTHFILSQTFSGSLFVDQTIVCPAQGETLSNNLMTEHETIVKNTKFSTLYRDQEQLKSEIVNIQTTVNGTSAQVSQIIQNAESVTGYFSNMEGSKYIRMSPRGIQVSETPDSVAQALITPSSFSVINDQNVEVVSMKANEFNTTNWVYSETRNGNCLNIFRRRT